MDEDTYQRKLAKSLEELIFGGHATRKNRLDIERVVAAVLDLVRDEITRHRTNAVPPQ